MKKLINENEINKNNNMNIKSSSQLKLNITGHYKIDLQKDNQELNNNEKDNGNNSDNDNIENYTERPEKKINFINDFYLNEERKVSPKTIDGKEIVHISDIIGDEGRQPILLTMIDSNLHNFSASKISSRTFGIIKSYAANTNQGIVRDYNEDRVSIIINMNRPEYYTSSQPWPKISYFGVFDGHAGNKCAEFLRDNLLKYIISNNFFPNDIPKAIKFGFKKIDEDYLKNYAYIDGNLIDNSGSCGLILLIVKNIIYIGNVGDSRCLGSFQNGKIQKDITIDHKPNSPLEKKRIIKNGGKIYQTQTPLEEDDLYKNNILIGPYRVIPGKLSVSRTVGDAEGKIEAIGGKKNVIISIPDIYKYNLEKDDIDFFILGCDGIYDQLSSKDVLDCAWNIIKNNQEIYKKSKNKRKNKNIFKGNYGNEINMNTTSGNIVDLILKASMLRKSFDNVTCLFISFKDFFDSSEKNEINKKPGLKDELLRNRSNIENIENLKKNDLIRFNKEIINSKANLSAQNFFNKENKDDFFSKNKLNLDDNNKVERNKVRIMTLPNQNINLKLNNKDEDKNNNCDNDNKKILIKNKTEVNLISNIKNKNDEVFKGKGNMERSNSFSNNLNENNLGNIKNNNLTTNTPIIKDKIKRKVFTNSILFSNTQIIDINRNKKKNNNKLKINNRIILNNKKEEDLRHSSYNKKIKVLNLDNSGKLGLRVNNTNIKIPKYENNLLFNNNNRKLNIKKNKEDNFISNDKKKLNKIKLENNKVSNSYKNIKSNNTKIHKIKDKLEFKKFYNNNIKIKFNHIIKSKNNNDKKKENEMPSLTDNLNDINIKRDNKFLKRNYSNTRKKLTYSEQKKIMNGEYKINLNLSNKNIFGNYKNIYYKSKKDNKGFYIDNRRKESNSSKYEK